eukprot:TRINITY_DN16586_c0_g1_i1.p1 TRINITY_DN16586_c0_g1~~TRINITY_DN16586_c0_g1_i1.p1  ORF type:complete len:715 (+),score=108.25 TRINITY_DN16586_c0_g1_i1:77-2146(+)
MHGVTAPMQEHGVLNADLFENFDFNNNGTVSREEFVHGMQCLQRGGPVGSLVFGDLVAGPPLPQAAAEALIRNGHVNSASAAGYPVTANGQGFNRNDGGKSYGCSGSGSGIRANGGGLGGVGGGIGNECGGGGGNGSSIYGRGQAYGGGQADACGCGQFGGGTGGIQRGMANACGGGQFGGGTRGIQGGVADACGGGQIGGGTGRVGDIWNGHGGGRGNGGGGGEMGGKCGHGGDFAGNGGGLFSPTGPNRGFGDSGLGGFGGNGGFMPSVTGGVSSRVPEGGGTLHASGGLADFSGTGGFGNAANGPDGTPYVHNSLGFQHGGSGMLGQNAIKKPLIRIPLPQPKYPGASVFYGDVPSRVATFADCELCATPGPEGSLAPVPEVPMKSWYNTYIYNPENRSAIKEGGQFMERFVQGADGEWLDVPKAKRMAQHIQEQRKRTEVERAEKEALLSGASWSPSGFGGGPCTPSGLGAGSLVGGAIGTHHPGGCVGGGNIPGYGGSGCSPGGEFGGPSNGCGNGQQGGQGCCGGAPGSGCTGQGSGLGNPARRNTDATGGSVYVDPYSGQPLVVYRGQLLSKAELFAEHGISESKARNAGAEAKKFDFDNFRIPWPFGRHDWNKKVSQNVYDWFDRENPFISSDKSYQILELPSMYVDAEQYGTWRARQSSFDYAGDVVTRASYFDDYPYKV